MKWAFLGCKEQGKLVLDTLLNNDYIPQFIGCLSALPMDEKLEFQKIASQLNIPLVLDTELNAQLNEFRKLDFALVCRYSLLPASIFTLPILGCINIHNSLLPQYRGIHPVQWALVNNEVRTGVTIHQIDDGVDTGAILWQRSLRIKKSDDFSSLMNNLNILSAGMCLQAFRYIHRFEKLPPKKNSSISSSYARRRTEEDSRVYWSSKTVVIASLVRAMQSPMPDAYCFSSKGEKIHIIKCKVLKLSQTSKIKSCRVGTVVDEPSQGLYNVVCSDGLVQIQTSIPLTIGSILD